MEIINKEILNSSKYLNFLRTKFRNQKNETDYWYSVERPNSGKTVIVAALHNDKLVVTREFRVAIGDYEWGIPAGLVDDDESPEQTARRELMEETNLIVDQIIGYTPYLYNSAGLTNEVASIVYCRASGIPGQSGNEKDEEIQSYLMDKAEVLKLMLDPSKKFSAKAYLIFERFVKGDLW